MGTTESFTFDNGAAFRGYFANEFLTKALNQAIELGGITVADIPDDRMEGSTVRHVVSKHIGCASPYCNELAEYIESQGEPMPKDKQEPNDAREHIIKHRQERAIKLYDNLFDVKVDRIEVRALFREDVADGVNVLIQTGEYEADLVFSFPVEGSNLLETVVFKSGKHKNPLYAIEECYRKLEGYRAKRRLDDFLLTNPKATLALIEMLGKMAEEEGAA